MPIKTRRKKMKTRRRRGTRSRGGNRRYHNGGHNPLFDKITESYRILENNVEQNPTIQRALANGKNALEAVKEKYSSFTSPSQKSII